MNWEAIGAVGELLGAVGVITTLVYLSRQIRDNSHQLKGTSTIAVYEYQRSLTEELGANPDMVSLIVRANHDWKALSPEEQRQVALWNINESGYWEMCYQLMRQGALDEAVYKSKEEYYLTLFNTPGRREWWDNETILLEAGFHGEMTRKMNESRKDEFATEHPYFYDDSGADRSNDS